MSDEHDKQNDPPQRITLTASSWLVAVSVQKPSDAAVIELNEVIAKQQEAQHGE